MSTQQQPSPSLDEAMIAELYPAYLRWMREELDEALERLSGNAAHEKLARQAHRPVSLAEFRAHLHSLPGDARDEYIRCLHIGRTASMEEATASLERELQAVWATDADQGCPSA